MKIAILAGGLGTYNGTTNLGMVIKAGYVSGITNPNCFGIGTGRVTLGDTVGNANATLNQALAAVRLESRHDLGHRGPLAPYRDDVPHRSAEAAPVFRIDAGDASPNVLGPRLSHFENDLDALFGATAHFGRRHDPAFPMR